MAFPNFDPMECERDAARKERDDALAKLAASEKKQVLYKRESQSFRGQMYQFEGQAKLLARELEEAMAKLAQAEKERDTALANWRMAVKNEDFEANRALERKHEIEDLRAQLALAKRQRDEALEQLKLAEEEREKYRLESNRLYSLWCKEENRAKMHAEACAELRTERDRLTDSSEWVQLIARLRREKLTILADYAGVLAAVCEDNPELTQYLDVLEGLSEQMTETVRDMKGGGE